MDETDRSPEACYERWKRMDGTNLVMLGGVTGWDVRQIAERLARDDNPELRRRGRNMLLGLKVPRSIRLAIGGWLYRRMQRRRQRA